MSDVQDVAVEAAPESVEPVESEVSEEIQEDVSSEEPVEGEEELSEELAEDGEESEGEEEDSEDLSKEEEKEIKQELKKVLKIKVDGKEIDEMVDLEDEDDLRKKLQMAHLAHNKAQELSSMRKNFEAFLTELKSNPRAVLSDLEMDFDELVDQRMNERMEELQKSPEQLEKEKMEKELADYKKKMENLEKQREEAEFARLQEEMALDFDRQVSEALETNPDLPRSPLVVKKIADTMVLAMDQGYKDVTVKDVLPYVQKEMMEDFQKYFDMLPEDALEKVVGKNNINRLRKRRISSKPPTPTASVKSTGKEGKVESKEIEKLTAKDFFKNLGSK